jgi:D-glycero-D-manno-heptose 1,7-bisphosphate phosphatase
MILDAIAAHGLNPARSAMVGDKASDMQAALVAGVATRILLTDDAAEAAAAPAGTRVLPDGALRDAAAMLAAMPE